MAVNYRIVGRKKTRQINRDIEIQRYIDRQIDRQIDRYRLTHRYPSIHYIVSASYIYMLHIYTYIHYYIYAYIYIHTYMHTYVHPLSFSLSVTRWLGSDLCLALRCAPPPPSLFFRPWGHSHYLDIGHVSHILHGSSCWRHSESYQPSPYIIDRSGHN